MKATMTRTSGVISDAAVEVLARCTVDGNLVRLPASPRLERKLYEEVNEVLSRLGGKWKGAKTQAHVFEASPADALRTVVDTAEMPPKNPMAFFATPDPVVQRMLAIAGDAVATARRALEPSAGDGAIARRLGFELGRDAALDLVELDPARAAKLPKWPGELHVGDFLSFTGGPYDLVVMNPPFTAPGDPLAYITHIRHALGLLAAGGRLVSVAPSGFVTRSDRRCTAFRHLVEELGGWEAVPAGAFKESGTGVSTLLLWLDGSSPRVAGGAS